MTSPVPRQRRAALAALSLAAVAGAALSAAGPPAGSRAPARRPARPAMSLVRAAPAAAQAARPPVTVTLDAAAVEWRAAPYADVGAWWYGGDSHYFSAFGRADSTGRVVLAWTDPTPERTDDDRPFEELSRLVLGTGVDLRETYTVTLPALDAEVDAPGDRIALRGPTGATLAVRVRRAVDRDVLALTGTDVVGGPNPYGGEAAQGALGGDRASGEPGRTVWAGTITADRDGAAEVRLAGTVDVQPGDGVEVQRVFAGDTFVLRRTAFQLVLPEGTRSPIALGRPGAAVALTVRDPDGRTRDCPTTIGRTGRSVWSCGTALDAGDRITVTHAGRLLPPTRAAATLPRLGYAAAAGGIPAALTGPPNARLRLAEVDALGGPSGLDVALDAQGRAALPAGRPARGSRFGYAWRDPNGITWGAGGAVPQIRLIQGEPRLRGVWPTATVTVTVTGRDGRPIGRWSQRTGASEGACCAAQPVALYDLRAGPRSGLHRLAPGERVEVVVGGDEPVVFTVPDLELALDDGRGRLTGRLPAGTRGTLAVLEPVEGDADPLRPPDEIADRRFTHRATLPINASPDGTFDIALTGLRDLDGHALPAHRLVLYAVTAERPDGHAFMQVVARPWLRIDARSATAEGFGPSGQAVVVDVADAAGRPVVRARGLDPDGPDGPDIDQPFWRAPLVDAVGAATALRAGDRVTVTAGAAATALTVPSMDAYVDLTLRQVRGRAAPNASLTVRLWGDGWGERRWVVRAGPDGSFETPLPADVPLAYGDGGEMTFRYGPHLVVAPIVVPSMLFDLSVGRLWGTGVAGAPVDVTVLRGGRPIASGHRLVDDALGYDLDPHDASGGRVPFAAGDVVVQRVAGRPPLTATVPVMSARWDAADGAIRGTLPADSRLDLFNPPGFERVSREWSLGWPDVTAAGAFTVTARHRRDLAAGLGALLQARIPSGVQARRWVVTPILNIPHGGDGVCGQAMPWARVHAEVTSGGEAAQGDGTADAAGRFRITLRRADGRPVALATGDVVRAEIDGAALEATLPALTLRVDRAAGRASGGAPPGATVSIEYPAGSCSPVDPAETAGAGGWLYSNEVTAGESGAYLGALPAVPRDATLTRPLAYEAAIFDAAGHRHFRLSRALRLTAVVDTDRVQGEADAGSAVAVTLTRPGGPTGRGTAVADALGRFTATLAADGGATVRLRAGDRVDATVGGEARGLTVPPLAVDWRPDGGLIGRTDPGATVQVRFALPRGVLLGSATDVVFVLTADAAGRFASAAASARGVWTAADVRRVEVWRSLAEDDRAMVAFDVAGGATPTPGPGGTPGAGDVGRALLPWAGR